MQPRPARLHDRDDQGPDEIWRAPKREVDGPRCCRESLLNFIYFKAR